MRVLTGLNQAAFLAILDVGELDPAVADTGAAKLLQKSCISTNFRSNGVIIAEQEAFVAATIADYFYVRCDFRVTFDKAADG